MQPNPLAVVVACLVGTVGAFAFAAGAERGATAARASSTARLMRLAGGCARHGGILIETADAAANELRREAWCAYPPGSNFFGERQ
jgi:hypothetical protein